MSFFVAMPIAFIVLIIKYVFIPMPQGCCKTFDIVIVCVSYIFVSFMQFRSELLLFSVSLLF